MTQVIYRPMEHWDRRTQARRPHSPFSAKWAATLSDLEREARLLGSTQVIVELALHEADLRLDGKPYADAKTEHNAHTSKAAPAGTSSTSTPAYPWTARSPTRPHSRSHEAWSHPKWT